MTPVAVLALLLAFAAGGRSRLTAQRPGGNATRLSEAGRRLIQSFEGLSLKAYPDGAGYSIGYGHYGAQAGDVISPAEAEALFDRDVARFEDAVAKAAPGALQHQFDAMTSLAYNIGAGAFATSTVAARHRAGDFAGAADAFLAFTKAGGVDDSRLVARRKRERAIYLGGL